ncbi:DNA-directed RNA polymerase subunit beta [Perilla frutescens var. hirtella]|uniref:DNA-directed RNA polymerase subunit beta n=1 Tax=Perilla frutescens var. hirtella TaxID=608512 RepID=A0AAD4PAZ2_PERFH|nr:DNA-directed RNA polymerase subunit beta [Perilla frutescens var. hirtella]
MATANKMLERALSVRRSPHATDDVAFFDDGGGDETGDESKTRKHISIAMRVTNFLTRTGYLWPVLVIGLLIVIIVSVIINSRDLVCISASTSDHISRLRFFGFDALESDFGSLGVPWCRSKHGKDVEWTSKDLLNGIEEFVPIYETRPIKNNMHGMGFDHSFGLWFMTRWLKPDLMIESGAFKGHSTWVLRHAMPDIPIISISPRHPEKYLKKGPAYVDGNCTYFAGKDFVDFGSMDWGKVMRKYGIKDRSRVLVFFDDHQNELKRLKQALKAGFKHLIFEDNYDTGTGDHYSLRQICDQFYIKGGGHSCFKDSDEARIRFRRRKFWEKAVDTDELCGPGEAWWGVRGQMRDDFNHSNKAITYAEHFQNSRFLESVLDVYWELPPAAGPSLTHQTRYDPARATTPIIEDGRYSLFRRLGLSQLDPSVFNGYTQMVYLQVSNPET